MSCLKGGNCEHGGCSDCQGEPNIKLGQDWLIKEGTNKMSSENIKTGLKLSDAVRLIEENENALIKYHGVNLSQWQRIYSIALDIDCKYDIKLPPPKTVTVALSDITKAYNETLRKWESFNLDEFCKELGL